MFPSDFVTHMLYSSVQNSRKRKGKKDLSGRHFQLSQFFRQFLVDTVQWELGPVCVGSENECSDRKVDKGATQSKSTQAFNMRNGSKEIAHFTDTLHSTCCVQHGTLQPQCLFDRIEKRCAKNTEKTHSFTARQKTQIGHANSVRSTGIQDRIIANFLFRGCAKICFKSYHVKNFPRFFFKALATLGHHMCVFFLHHSSVMQTPGDLNFVLWINFQQHSKK